MKPRIGQILIDGGVLADDAVLRAPRLPEALGRNPSDSEAS
jgi:hypothetical protein